MGRKILDRKDIARENTWDIESLFPNIDAWEEGYEKVKVLANSIVEYKGKLAESPKKLLEALKTRDELGRNMENVYVYTHLLLDQDTRDSLSQALAEKSMNLYVTVNEKTSFFIPELLLIDEGTIKDYLNENRELEIYRHFLEDTMRQKPHVLSTREESILAQMGEIAASPEKIYSMLNNADLTFPKILDEEKKEIEITQGNFIPLMESRDREVRKNAFKNFYQVYGNFENTFAATLNGELKNNIFSANLRNYKSTRHASLEGNNIPISVYDNLIKSVHKNLNSMYKYIDLRKRLLEIEEVHMYDLYTPIVKDYKYEITFQESKDLIMKALEPLGEGYTSIMREGFESRWIDVYENRGKRSGAYSSGSYDSKPFILLNYHNTLDNLFTVAHEMGHSMHSYFTRKKQPYIYGNYSIFVAEVASTVNEALLLDYMIKNSKDKMEKAYLINHYLESFRTIVFRQTMFAEFEKIINQHLEAGGGLTADYLNGEYKKLNKLYYGPDLVIDDEIAVEWARIPHFYYNFYVYQYATGFAAAIDLSQKILKNQSNDIDKYLSFLKSGSSDYPINVLRRAGVDMTSIEPINNVLSLFDELLEEFIGLV